MLPPRVRFAPSPTGVLHIGSVRTALFNWLYARHNGGKFLLRIEDTDRVRSTDQNTRLIFEILEWLKLDWDEEPVIQSSRFERHREIAESMVASGMAYRCRCSPDELAAKKAEAVTNGKSYKYDGTCRDEAVDCDQSVIRLRAGQTGTMTVADLVQGSVTIERSQLDDFVLLRSDGAPTYMLSVVVDDHDMGITHVIRGDDHLTNTFKQIQIYEACGWAVPSFAHIPLIYGPDGAKLSKRHGAASAVDYRDLGYLPETISNYLLRLGWSHGDDEIIPRDLAVEWFDLKNVGRSPSRFDMKKLQNLNAHYIRNRDNSSLMNYMLPFLNRDVDDSEKAKILRGMNGLKDRAKTVVDLAESAMTYVEPPSRYDSACSKYATEAHICILRDVIGVLSDVGISETEEQISQRFKDLSKKLEVKLVEVAQAMRAALCGKLVSPSVFQIIEIIGPKDAIDRISAFIQRFVG
ncbi:MAG: glutamate--tRNA ligase [Holosporales bacterium]|jgi:glutamyl-tRNA synthetase|nr:glutamate--tRNA ligase [Holosporales bacterium]